MGQTSWEWRACGLWWIRSGGDGVGFGGGVVESIHSLRRLFRLRWLETLIVFQTVGSQTLVVVIVRFVFGYLMSLLVNVVHERRMACVPSTMQLVP
jgi:hypothetical protein